MAKVSKFFRVAFEGATCDGRTISRQDIVDMAETYNRQTYGARINMEHLRGFSAEPPFCAYGDVIALKYQPDELELGGKKLKGLGLYAQVEPNDELLKVNAKGQKVYSSIEINPNFANSGKAYLQGLAVTDSPASLGTEILQFAAGLGDANPFNPRKVDKGNFFSAALETSLEFEDVPDAPADSAGVLAGMAKMFEAFAAKFGKAEEPAPVTPPASPTPPANDNLSQFAAQLGQTMTGALKTFADANDARMKTVETGLAELKQLVETTADPKNFTRKPATGGNGRVQADY